MYTPGAVMQHPNGIRLTAFDAQGNVLHIGTYFLSTAVHRRARGDGQRGARGVQSNSLLEAIGKGWFTYFRIYGPGAPAFDGSWRPGDFQEVK
jgi:hypothetical protein